MVSFELGKEIEKNVFSSCHERGIKKILSTYDLLHLIVSASTEKMLGPAPRPWEYF